MSISPTVTTKLFVCTERCGELPQRDSMISELNERFMTLQSPHHLQLTALSHVMSRMNSDLHFLLSII
jgi:hypothetical protein